MSRHTEYLHWVLPWFWSLHVNSRKFLKSCHYRLTNLPFDVTQLCLHYRQTAVHPQHLHLQFPPVWKISRHSPSQQLSVPNTVQLQNSYPIVLILANLSQLRGGRLSTSETDWQETKTNFYQRIWATCKLSYFKTKQSQSSSSTLLLLLAPQSITNLLPSTGPDTATLVTNF